jgi:hypothetical protein
MVQASVAPIRAPLPFTPMGKVLPDANISFDYFGGVINVTSCGTLATRS